MRKRASEDPQFDMVTAAYLASEGKRQKEIAGILGLGQTAVSRLLVAARRKYLREEVHFLSENVDSVMMQRVLQRTSQGRLSDALARVAQAYSRRPGPVLRVFPCPNTDSADRRESMVALSRQAAPYIRRLLMRCRICGITWGGMLWHLVAALRLESPPAPWSKEPIEFVPLSGEPLGDAPTSFSSSSLAQEFGTLANGVQYTARSLAMVPAFIPANFDPKEKEAVRKLIGLARSYKEIFGSLHRPEGGHVKATHDEVKIRGSKKGESDISEAGRPLAERLDMILTSVGPAESPLGFGKGRLFESSTVTGEELQQLILGDIGGVCIPRLQLTDEQKNKLDSLRGRWTGPRIRHLRGCADQGASSNPFGGCPGIVVVSVGATRARFIFEAVKRGLVNHLIIDDSLARELSSIAGVGSAQATPASQFAVVSPGH